MRCLVFKPLLFHGFAGREICREHRQMKGYSYGTLSLEKACNAVCILLVGDLVIVCQHPIPDACILDIIDTLLQNIGI